MSEAERPASRVGSAGDEGKGVAGSRAAELRTQASAEAGRRGIEGEEGGVKPDAHAGEDGG